MLTLGRLIGSGLVNIANFAAARTQNDVAGRRRMTGASFVLQNPHVRYRPVKLGVLLLALGGALMVRPARASLGGDAASVAADAAELHGTARATPLPQYDIQEITSDSGMRVREYLTRDGTVFAVTWDGPVVPDLRTLLGPSFESYIKGLAAIKQPGTHRSLRLASSTLVVESGGHMRAYSGRAYLPLMVPAAVSPANLR
jgi:Protein of unknown function (DUF2844)